MESLAFAVPILPVQPTPAGDVAVIYLEADDLQAAFAGIGLGVELEPPTAHPVANVIDGRVAAAA